MGVISISVSYEDEQQLEKAMRLCGTTSRSRAVRIAMNSLLKEYADLENLKEMATAVFTITYNGRHTNLTRVLHGFDGNLKLSTHIESEKGCAEIIVVEGKADEIRRLFRELRNNKEVKNLSCAFA